MANNQTQLEQMRYLDDSFRLAIGAVVGPLALVGVGAAAAMLGYTPNVAARDTQYSVEQAYASPQSLAMTVPCETAADYVTTTVVASSPGTLSFTLPPSAACSVELTRMPLSSDVLGAIAPGDSFKVGCVDVPISSARLVSVDSAGRSNVSGYASLGPVAMAELSEVAPACPTPTMPGIAQS